MTDARFLRSQEAVHQAVCAVLVTEGLGGLTVDRLAAESGISRSTIYRNWPDMAALACEVFDDLMHRDDASFDGAVPQAVREYLADYADRLNDPVYLAVLVALIDGSSRDPAFAEVHARAFSQTRSRAGSIVRRGQADGVIDSSLDVQGCVEDMVAPFLYRRLVRQVRITRRHVDDLATDLIHRWAPVFR